jgi:hypothetical protein
MMSRNTVILPNYTMQCPIRQQDPKGIESALLHMQGFKPHCLKPYGTAKCPRELSQKQSHPSLCGKSGFGSFWVESVQLMKINKRMCDLHCTSIKLVHKASSYNK